MLFVRHGFERAQIDEIAAEAGRTRGAVTRTSLDRKYANKSGAEHTHLKLVAIAGWNGACQVWYVDNMNQRVDIVRNSLPPSNELFLETIEKTTDGIVLRTFTKRPLCCPACLQSRVSYHSRYVRRMRDLPWQGRRVEIHLQTRRFQCQNKEFRRKIFANNCRS
jgi:hypothetical protein